METTGDFKDAGNAILKPGQRRFAELRKQWQINGGDGMSVSKWAYIPECCDGEPCPGDCDICSKAEENVAEMWNGSNESYNAILMSPDGYCAWGQRREDGDA